MYVGGTIVPVRARSFRSFLLKAEKVTFVQKRSRVGRTRRKECKRFCGMQPSPQATPVAAVTAEAQMTSAAAFVDGGLQDGCHDACSICLENFCENDPATVTTCKHEYHLQCILEWSQRSKECPMCWRPLSLKDPDSQVLLAATEHERIIHHQRSSPFYQRAAQDDTEFHRFGPSYGDDSDLEDRIMQHLAAVAMGRAHQFARRGESLRFRQSSGQGHPHFMIVPANSNQSPAQLSRTTVGLAGGLSPPSSTSSPDVGGLESSTDHAALNWSTSTYGHSISESVQIPRTMDSSSMKSYSLRQQALLEPVEQEQHGTSSSELSFTQTFKSRLAAASSRYRESLSKTTRGFRGRLRARSGTMAELGTRAREVSVGVVRALERISLESVDKNRDFAGTDIQAATTLVQSGSSSVSDGSDHQVYSSNSVGGISSARNVAASSIRTSSHSSDGEASHSLDCTPANGQGSEESSDHCHDVQRNLAGPIPA